MKFSSVPLLFVAIAFFWVWITRASSRRGELTSQQVRAIHVWLGLLATWGVVTTLLARLGAYQSMTFYSMLPGLWLPMAPVVLSLALVWCWPSFRSALWITTTRTSPQAFLWLHALRIAAIGSVIKCAQGLLPSSFVIPVGVPDLLFGLISLGLAVSYRRHPPGRTALIAWNLAGMGVLMPAPILMQLGLPGRFHTFVSQPDASTLFQFPMVLAPTLIVTLLFFLNGWHAFTLWRTSAEGDITRQAANTREAQ